MFDPGGGVVEECSVQMFGSVTVYEIESLVYKDSIDVCTKAKAGEEETPS